MTAQESLLPCPFCGGEAVASEINPKAAPGWFHLTVTHNACFYKPSQEVLLLSAAELARWNRRHPVARTPLSDALAEYDKLRDHVAEQTCCMDGGCLVKRPKGMHTNGGCKCSRDNIAAQRMMYAGQRLAEAAHGITQEKQG